MKRVLLILTFLLLVSGCTTFTQTTIYFDWEYHSDVLYRVTNHYYSRYGDLVIEGYFVRGGYVETLTFSINDSGWRETYVVSVNSYVRTNQFYTVVVRPRSHKTSGRLRVSVR